jgi:membrane fusion protein, multidrug efflux system
MRPFVGICLLLVLLTGCDEKKAPPPAPKPAVGVQPAAMKGVNRTFEFVGRIKAVNQVDLRARVEGFLEKIQFREGQDVKAGSGGRSGEGEFGVRPSLGRQRSAAI